MRKHLFLFSAACILLLSFLAACSTGHKAARHNAVVRKAPIAPKSADSEFSAAHHNKVVYARPVQNQKPVVSASHVAVTNTAHKVIADTGKIAVVANGPSVTDAPKTAVVAAMGTSNTENTTQAGSHEVNPSPVIEETSIQPAPPAIMPEEPANMLMSKYAGMINVNTKEVNNYPLYHFIDDWYGTEYKYGGVDVNGIDCSAFSQKLYNEVYGTDLLRTVKQQRSKTCEKITREDEVTEGDLVFFRIRRFRISHVGIYLANGYFVHASSSHGVTISNMGDRYWQKRFAGYGRMEKEDNVVTESEFTP